MCKKSCVARLRSALAIKTFEFRGALDVLNEAQCLFEERSGDYILRSEVRLI